MSMPRHCRRPVCHVMFTRFDTTHDTTVGSGADPGLCSSGWPQSRTRR